MKDRKQIQRGKRYVRQGSSSGAAQQTGPAQAIASRPSSERFGRGLWPNNIEQQLLISQSPSDPLVKNPFILSGGSLNQGNDQNLLNARDILPLTPTISLEGGSGWPFNVTTSGLPDVSMTTSQRLASPTSELSFNIDHSQLAASQLQSDRRDLALDDFDNFTCFYADDRSSGLFQWSPFNASSFYHQESSIETGITIPGSSFIGSGRFLVLSQQSFELRNQSVRFLPSEAFLGDQSMSLTTKPNSILKPSLLGSLTVVSFFNLLQKSDGTADCHINQVDPTFRMLSGLIPSTAGAVISEQQITDTSIIRMVLYSMINGFAGISEIPIDSLLLCLKRLAIFKPSFEQLLQRPPSPAKRSFVDNLFRASIDAQDEDMVQMILKYDLVDVNNMICFYSGRKCTPVEKAASLESFNIIRILADHGADINKSYEGSSFGSYGALEYLFKSYLLLSPESRAPSLELINTTRFLIDKGSKVRITKLDQMARRSNSDELASLLLQAASLADHRAYFEFLKEQQEVRLYSIMKNMIKLCQSRGGSCLAEFPDVMEMAAVEAARRDQLEVVELLIEYVQATDMILIAAITSRNTALVQFLIDRKVCLNPPARTYEGITGQLIATTPFAEALRTGNRELVSLLESQDPEILYNLTDHDRLEAAILGAVKGANIDYLKSLLAIASRTKVKLRIPPPAMELALCYGGDEVAQLLIREGAKINESDLEAAIRRGNEETVATILAHDLYSTGRYSTSEAVLQYHGSARMQSMLDTTPDDIGMPLDDWKSTLTAFCEGCMRNNKVEQFKLFVEASFDPNWDWNGCLAEAVRQGDHEMASYLVQKGADPFSTEVLTIAMSHRPKLLPIFLGDAMFDGKKTRFPQKCVGSKFLRFLMSENIESVEARVLDHFLETGAINLVAPEEIVIQEPPRYLATCVTPLGLAISGISNCCTTNLSAINKFLVAGADPNGLARLETHPHRCVTALMTALETGREDVVSLLIERGADVNLQPYLSLRRTPLQYAAELGNLDMIRLLLQHGAQVNSPPAFQGGGTALQFAAISGNCNIAAELLEHGARLDVPPPKVDGRWPLEGAAEHGRLDMIQLLWNARELSPGNLGFEKRQCLRAMDFARVNGHLGCQDLIVGLSGLSVEMLDMEDYGVPWLA